jgi:DNA-binding transcriptional MerR regulator
LARPEQTFTTQMVADLAGVTKRCILNWLRDNKISEPDRDRNQYRVWTQRDLSLVLAYKAKRSQPKNWGQHAKNRDPEP